MGDFLKEAFTPSEADEGAYEFFLIAVAHCVLGAAIAGWHPVLAWAFCAVYFAYQIIRDLNVGRTIWDSVVDTAFVALGIALLLPDVWLVAAAVAMLIRERFRP